MKLQDKLQEIKKETTAKYGFKSWSECLKYVSGVEDEVAIAFAKYCCERQRMSDYKISNNLDILNNPLITDEL